MGALFVSLQLFALLPLLVKGHLPKAEQEQRRLPSLGWNVDDLVPKGYNKLVPPKADGLPVRVKIRLNVTQILLIDEAEQSFSVNCHYKQYWKDSRLQLPDNLTSLALEAYWRSSIWVPDTYFYNAIDGRKLDLLAPSLHFELTNESYVHMTFRTVVKLSCDMDLTLFPHDTQTCEIIFVSLTHTEKNVVFEWDTFDLVEKNDFPKFMIDSISNRDCINSRRTGYSCIKSVFVMRRRWSYYAIRIYGPSFLLVITSFVGFWIPVMGYPARVIIAVTPLLALVTQQTQINNEINVSYVVALHIWMMACTTFTFMVLAELGFAIAYCHQVEDKKDGKDCSHHRKRMSLPATLGPSNGHHEGHHHGHDHSVSHFIKGLLSHVYGNIDWSKAPTDRNKIDYCARIMFPVTFAIFIVLYFTVLYGAIPQKSVQ